MGRVRYFVTVLRHRVPEFEAEGYVEVSEDPDCPSGALEAMGEIPVLMVKEVAEGWVVIPEEAPCDES